jgi:hypothetical protein
VIVRMDGSKSHTIGEMAHIKGDKPGSNRHDLEQKQEERDDYANLILLCPTHHAVIDRQENEGIYPVELLLAMKNAHENFVVGKLENTAFADKNALARALYPHLIENREVFLAYGPRSDIARKNPDSDAHLIWVAERLATIVPNNRKMMALIEQNIDHFSPCEQEVLLKFRTHARGYERWVLDEVSYEGISRFPPEFHALIEELASAST